MSPPARATVLLAIDAGVRETGWAIFRSGQVASSGVIRARGVRRMDVPARVSHLLQCLDQLVEEHQPRGVVTSQPSGIHWPVPALEALDTALARWSQRHQLPLYAYTAQEVRTAVAGHPNAPRDQLGYAVMVRLGLIGQSRTTHEWEAIAAGYYHLRRWPARAGLPSDERWHV